MQYAVVEPFALLLLNCYLWFVLELVCHSILVMILWLCPSLSSIFVNTDKQVILAGFTSVVHVCFISQ